MPDSVSEGHMETTSIHSLMIEDYMKEKFFGDLGTNSLPLEN